MQLIYRRTSEIRVPQNFVTGLGASSYTFAEATWLGNRRTGWDPTYVALSSSAVHHRYWYRIICSAAPPKRTGTNLISIPVTATWLSITVLP